MVPFSNFKKCLKEDLLRLLTVIQREDHCFTWVINLQFSYVNEWSRLIVMKYAITASRPTIVRFLIQAGADVNAIERDLIGSLGYEFYEDSNFIYLEYQ